jgi:excisionase family DNA binding protein
VEPGWKPRERSADEEKGFQAGLRIGQMYPVAIAPMVAKPVPAIDPNGSELLTFRQKPGVYDGDIDACTVASLLNKPVRTIWGWARDGKIPATKVNRSWSFNPAELMDWYEENHSKRRKKPAASVVKLRAQKKLS